MDITRTERIAWGILMCGEGATALRMEYTLMNPNGEHLGTGYIPLPTTYRTFAVFGAHIHRPDVLQPGLAPQVHDGTAQAVLGAPIVKILHEAAGMFSWQAVSSYGYRPRWVALMSTATISLNEASTHFIMILIARGWLMTRRTLPVNEAQSTVTVAILVRVEPDVPVLHAEQPDVLRAGHHVHGGADHFVEHGRRNIRELKMQMMILRQADIDPTNTPAHTKEAMYRSFQFYIFTFVCTRIFLEMVLLFLPEHPWIGHVFTGSCWTCCFASSWAGFSGCVRTTCSTRTKVSSAGFPWIPRISCLRTEIPCNWWRGWQSSECKSRCRRLVFSRR